MASYYNKAKTALKLFNESDLPMGQLYALECIADDKKIIIHSFPSSLINKNSVTEKRAAYHLSTPKYNNLTMEEAKEEYVSFVKMLLMDIHRELVFANQILNDNTIPCTPKVTKF